MEQLRQRVPELTRERLVNPHGVSVTNRVLAAGATQFHLKFQLEELGHGYSRIVPLDIRS